MSTSAPLGPVSSGGVDPDLAAALPADAAQGLASWEAATGRRVFLDRLLTNGFTDAVVAIVLIDGGGEPARKVDLKVIPSGARVDEPGAHAAALAGSPEGFAQAHLVRQAFDPYRVDGWTVMFQDLAGGSVAGFRPLSALSGTADVPSALAAVAGSVLHEWNDAPAFRSLTVAEFMRWHVRHKLDPGGSLSGWIAAELGEAALVADALVFAADDRARPVPNPVRLCWDAGPAQERVNAIVGNAHGDLHLENVLVPVDGIPRPDQFRLIDLSAFDGAAPLTRDPANLLLSEIARVLPGLRPRSRRALLGVVADTDGEGAALPADLATLRAAAEAVLAAGQTVAADGGLADEWRDQHLLSVAGGALAFASRAMFDTADRTWFFELAARAADRWAAVRGVPAPTAGTAVGTPLDERRRTARAAAERVADACGGFDGTVAAAALVPAGVLTPDAVADLAAAGWDLVVEFDPATDLPGGGWAAAQAAGVPGRLVAAGQAPGFGRRTTTWLAAAGLAAPGAAPAPAGPRQWRMQALAHVRDTVGALAASTGGPIVLVVLGEPDDRARAVAEATIDAAGDRLRLLTVADSPDGPFDAYAAEHLSAEPGLVASHLPRRPRPGGGSAGGPATLPGGPAPGGRIAVDDEVVAWFDGHAELLHSRTGLDADSVVGVGTDYYRGRVITWFELSAGVDVPRPGAVDHLERAVRRQLADRGTRRHAYQHSPGAGGTTVVRRVAWQLHHDHPILVASGVADPRPLADRIRELGRLTDRQVLVVIENTSANVTDALFDQLRADTVPALLLLVGRRTTAPSPALAADPERYLGPLGPDERDELVRLFAPLAPDRRADLERLSRRPAEMSVPFFYALTAFQDDYVGLADYVRRGLAGADGPTRDVLAALAITHRYAGTAVAANTFAPALMLPRDAPVRLAARLGQQADGLVLEDRPGAWRTAHALVAQELLAQLLAPPGDQPAAAGAWRAALAQRCIDLIVAFADAYPQGLPGDERLTLDALFVLRDSHDAAGGARRAFSEALETIPSAEGRLEVLRVLAETFSDQAHYWAHYGRLLSYQAGDHPKARQALDKALALRPDDTVLWHMSGVVRRNELRDICAHRPPADPAQVQSVVDAALSDLARASDLDDASEYPPVEAARLCVDAIEWAKKRSGDTTYATFLRRPTSAYWAALLDTAEEALERLREIDGDDKPSRFAEQARADLRELYDDYAGLLEGWRNLLARPGVVKAPVRRRLVRAYRSRAGGWRAAPPAQLAQAVALLEDNLRDDPSDGPSVREWLRVARLLGAGLDRAAELVSYWAERDPSRDALFYQSVVYALLALDGRATAVADYDRASGRSRDRAQTFPRRRFVYEWLGHGAGLGRLVHHSDVSGWQRSRTDEPDPNLLARVPGRVISIAKSQSGQLEFGPGLRAFFVPSFSGMVAGRDENKSVTALIGFAYDGPQAWSVRPA